MPLGGRGGNAKDNNQGEGEGGGSPPGSKGEATEVEGPQQMPPRHRVTLPPEVADGEGQESLVGLPEGFAGWATVGGYCSCFFVVFCLLYIFILAWCIVMFVICTFLFVSFLYLFCLIASECTILSMLKTGYCTYLSSNPSPNREYLVIVWLVQSTYIFVQT